ncbi:hypothetical protein BB560_004260 [Smittium megazygosporum]|uniref:RING-type domain-containing protein n=1 Tax=Smittium megazygosporum TaxID=133381 RepID=A0A2T9Z9T7_9FUNG|nr:hypothetical protein BB560_004260 [Smittium megazygosporum]
MLILTKVLRAVEFWCMDSPAEKNYRESETAISGLGRRVGQLDTGQTENAEYRGTKPDQSPHPIATRLVLLSSSSKGNLHGHRQSSNRQNSGSASTNATNYLTSSNGVPNSVNSVPTRYTRNNNRCQLKKVHRLNPDDLDMYPILPLYEAIKVKQSYIPDMPTELEKGILQSKPEGELNSIDCSFCFQKIKMTDEVRSIPCFHFFHVACLDPWLLSFGYQCPTCRFNLSQTTT